MNIALYHSVSSPAGAPNQIESVRMHDRPAGLGSLRTRAASGAAGSDTPQMNVERKDYDYSVDSERHLRHRSRLSDDIFTSTDIFIFIHILLKSLYEMF